MRESEVRTKHEADAKVAFAGADCHYFPGSRVISRYRGKQLHELLQKAGHTALAYENCSCRLGVTKTLEQERADLHAARR